ncbi:MAG: hypothetical protein AAGB04_30110 [Pseudomonadota bacterium]
MAISSLTLRTSPAITPTSSIFRGQHDPSTTAGPEGGESGFASSRGTVLNPTGSGVWRYVDGSASSSGNGLSIGTAYKTIQEAINAHQAGDAILVEPGIYSEALNIPFGQNRATETDRVKLCRRGTGKVEVTATDALGGWSAAASGDADNNPNWANLWKVTVSNTRTVPLYASMLMQNGVAAFMRVSGDSYTTTAQMFSQNDIAKFYTNANAGISGSLSGSVLTLTSASLFGGYASGDLDDARVIAQYTPGNNGQQCPVLSHTPGSNEVTCAFTRPAYGDGIALMNVAKDIDAPGQWAYKDNGDGTSTIYFWPYNSGQMSLIRLTERTTCVNFNAAEHWTFYGIDATGAGGINAEQGNCWWSQQHNIYDRPGLIFEECKAYASVNADGWNHGFDLERTPDAKMYHCDAVSITNGRGMRMVESPGGWIDQCKVENVGNTAVQLSKADEQVFSYSSVVNVASIHGNGLSAYQGTRKLVVWGNFFDTRGAIGLTRQESADLYFGMNLIIAPEGEVFGHRGLEDNGTNPARRDGTIFSGQVVLLNNSVAPWATATGSENVNATITCKTTNVTHHCCNSVTFGGIDPTDGGLRAQPTQNGTAPNDYYTTVGTYEDNIVLGGNLNDPSDTFFQSGNNSHESVIADLFADYANGDYSPKAAGPLDGVGGDHSALLPSGAWIDWFDFDRDYNGTAFTWASGAPIGALL